MATDEEIPLTMVWKKLDDDDAVLEVMIVDVPTDPPTLEVSVLPEEERVLDVERLVTERLEAVAFVTERPDDTRLLDTVRLVVEALAKVLCPVTLSEVRVA